MEGGDGAGSSFRRRLKLWAGGMRYPQSSQHALETADFVYFDAEAFQKVVEDSQHEVLRCKIGY